MTSVRLVNMIPVSASGEAGQDSEPQLAVNPRNPDEMVATAFTAPVPGTSAGPLYVSTDRGDTWTSRNAGLTIAQYYPGIGVSPQGTVITGGSQDNGSHIFTGSMFWTD